MTIDATAGYARIPAILSFPETTGFTETYGFGESCCIGEAEDGGNAGVAGGGVGCHAGSLKVGTTSAKRAP